MVVPCLLLHHDERVRGGVVVIGLFLVVVRWCRDFDPPEHGLTVEMIWCKGIGFVVVIVLETYTMPTILWVAITVYSVAFCGNWTSLHKGTLVSHTVNVMQV